MSDVKISVGVVGADEAAKSLAEVRKSATGAGSDMGAMQEPTGRLADALAQLKAQGDEAAKTSEKAGQGMTEMGKGAMGAGHLLHGLEAGLNGSIRGFMAAASGARHLLEVLGMGALSGVTMLIFGIGAAVMTLAKAFDHSEEEAKKLAEQTKELEARVEKWRSLHLDDMQKEYQNVRAEIEGALKSIEMLHAAQLRLMDARTAGKLADLEIDEQLALEKLSPGDTLGRKRVSKEFADRRADVQDQGNIDKAFVGLQLAQRKAESAAEKVRITEKQGEDLVAAYTNAQGARGALEEEEQDIGFKLTDLFLSKSDKQYLLKRREDIRKELERIQDEQRDRMEKGRRLSDQYDEEQAAAVAAGIDVEAAKAGFSTARNRRNVTASKSRNEDQQIDAEEAQRDADRASEKKRQELQQRLRDLDKEREADARQDQDDALEEQRVRLADRQAREKRRRENVIRKRDHLPLLPDFPESGEPEENIERRAASEARNRDLEDRRRQIEDEQRAAEEADRERRRAYETTPVGPHTRGPIEEAPAAAAASASGPGRIAWGSDAEALGGQVRQAQATAALERLHRELETALDKHNAVLVESITKLIHKVEQNTEQVRQLPSGN